MKYASLTLCIMILVVLTGCKGASQVTASTANNMKTAAEAARKAMDSLPQLVTQANYQSMGFASLDEVKAARLGPAVPRRVMSYNALVSMQAGATVSSLFTNDEQSVYPIQVGESVKSTITVSKRGENWQISSLGDAFLAGLFTAAGANRSAMELISVPGLNMEFAGIRQGDDWTLIPAQDYPQAGLARGRTVKAAEALPAISRYAKEFDKQYGEQLRNRKLVK